MKKLLNPFVTSGCVTKIYFCDREQEIDIYATKPCRDFVFFIR
jgi:hypothetical protein